MQLWDTATWLPLTPLPAHNAPIVKVSFSPDGTTLMSVDEAQEMRIWRVAK